MTLSQKDLGESCGAYANIDMPREERERRGIPLNYSDQGEPHTAEQVEAWHFEREQFMVERLLLAQQRSVNEPTLLICGRLHRERIASILRSRGVEVEVIDLKDFDWFSDEWHKDYPL